MRHQHMSGIAARDLNAEIAGLVAELFFAAIACRAIAAADPRIGDTLVAHLDVLHIRADRHDFALDFMAEREGEFPSGPHIELVAAAHVEMTVVNMHVGMADAAMRHLQQYFRTLRLRGLALNELQRLAIFDNSFGFHESASWKWYLARAGNDAASPILPTMWHARTRLTTSPAYSHRRVRARRIPRRSTPPPSAWGRPPRHRSARMCRRQAI